MLSSSKIALDRSGLSVVKTRRVMRVARVSQNTGQETMREGFEGRHTGADDSNMDFDGRPHE